MSGWEPFDGGDLPVVDLDALDPPDWGDPFGEELEADPDGHINVVLVSPHPILTEAFAWMIEGLADTLHVIAEAHTPGEARVVVADTRPHVVVLDAAFVEEDPIALVRALLHEHPSVAVVLLTDSENSNDLRDALAAGAKGYLLKQASGEELVNVIVKTVQNEILISDALIGSLVDSIHPTGYAENLTRRELQVVDLLEKEMSDSQIASVLGISIRTVQKHLTNMYHKCDVSSREEMIAFVRRRGVGLR